MTQYRDRIKVFFCALQNALIISLLIGGCLFQLLTASVGFSAYDEKKFCRMEANLVVIFVDVTTPFDNHAIENFRDGIGKIVERLNGGERILIYTIEDSFTNSKRLYEGCVPVCEPSWNIFSECTEGLVRLKTREQLGRIGYVLRERLMNATELPKSEIIRTLAMVLGSTGEEKRSVLVYIFSDLIENSEFISGKTFWSQPVERTVDVVKENELLPDLRNASVKIFGVGRDGTAQRRPLAQVLLAHLKRFWILYFEKTGCIDLEINESLEIR